MLAGLVAAIILVIQAVWNPFAPWLVATYCLLVLMSVVGKFGTDGWIRHFQSSLRFSWGGLRSVMCEASSPIDARCSLD